MFFIPEKQQKTILNFSLDLLIVTEQYSKGTLKILNLLNEGNDSKSVTGKWNIVDDSSNTDYDRENL